MPDYREELLTKTLIKMNEAGISNLDTIRNILIDSIRDYEISERCTELAVLDDANEKMIKAFLATKRIEGGSDGTAKSRWYILRRFNIDVNKPFDEIVAFDILIWLKNEESRVSLQTVNGYRNMLNSMFTWLFDNEYISKNPMKTIKPIKHPNVIITAFTPVEVDSMRSACKSVADRAMIELLLASGMRCEEMCDLKWEHINFITKDVLIVEGKGRKSRITMIDDVARKYLVKHKDTQQHPSEYVFSRKYRGEISNRTTNAVWQLIKGIAKRAGIEDVHPHRFRHTFATERYRHGMDIRMIQRLLGHSSINTTMRYIDGDLESLRDAYKRSV